MSAPATVVNASAPLFNPADYSMVERRWHAVYTAPRNEKMVVKHLDVAQVESFLPTYTTLKVWKNRQRMKILLPLFPTYLFVHISMLERTKVLKSPGVLQILGSKCDQSLLPDSEIELLRSGLWNQKMEPYRDLVVGDKVRIRNGVMQGVQGTLVRKGGSDRFVLTIEMINQHVAIHVDAEDLEPVLV